MAPAALRIDELQVRGLRTLGDIRLPLSPLCVLIGDNGSGKSSLIEACEILKNATSEQFLRDLQSIHGGLRGLLHPEVPALELGVIVGAAEDTQLQYHFALSAAAGGGAAILDEALAIRSKGSRWRQVLTRDGAQAQVCVSEERQAAPAFDVLRRINPGRLLLADFQSFPGTEGWAREARLQMIAALQQIQVQVPMEVMPLWVARRHERRSAIRGSTLIAPALELEQLGGNLANVYHALRNEFGADAWQQTLDYVRRGLGEDIEDVTTWADPGGGHIGLSLKFRGRGQAIPAAQLADGMLVFLALVAVFRLSTLRQPAPSLLVFDEPELHLHPQLLMRALDFFEAMSRDFPVLLATHSDRLLDGLSNPAEAVVLCELSEEGKTRLLRPDKEALARWLQRYRGLGDLRGAGHDASVLTEPVPAHEEDR